jgi:ketosteroid isomerase-like protein
MSREKNVAIAQKFLALVGGGKDPDEIAALCAEDLRFEIQGDDGVLPWIGRKTGGAAVADFVREMRVMTEPVTFDVEDILASDARVAIIGALATRVKSSGKVIHSQFAIILTVAGNVVTRFQMLEDSFDVSRAVRG